MWQFELALAVLRRASGVEMVAFMVSGVVRVHWGREGGGPWQKDKRLAVAVDPSISSLSSFFPCAGSSSLSSGAEREKGSPGGGTTNELPLLWLGVYNVLDLVTSVMDMRFTKSIKEDDVSARVPCFGALGASIGRDREEGRSLAAVERERGVGRTCGEGRHGGTGGLECSVSLSMVNRERFKRLWDETAGPSLLRGVDIVIVFRLGAITFESCGATKTKGSELYCTYCCAAVLQCFVVLDPGLIKNL